MTQSEGPKSGEWYFGVHCRACRAFTVLSQDPGGPGAHARIHDEGKLTVTCSACGATGEYRNEELQSIQAP
jgi:hypothetical protein